MERVLIFSPHPDDDIIACGGTIARHIHEGHSVTILYLTSGEAGSINHSPEELARIREAEASRAAAKLGVFDLIFLRNADGYISFDRVLLEQLISIIRENQPTMVYLPHGQESANDHQITNLLGTEACKRAAGPWYQNCGLKPWSVKTVWGYEVWTPLQSYQLAVDITDYIDIKMAALSEHKSQLASIAYDDAAQGLNRYRGIMSGMGKYCECFQLLKTSWE